MQTRSSFSSSILVPVLRKLRSKDEDAVSIRILLRIASTRDLCQSNVTMTIYKSSRDLFLFLFLRTATRRIENREKKNPNDIYTIKEDFLKEFFSFFLILSLSSIESKNCQIKSRGGLKLKATWLVLINARLSLEGVSPSFRERSKLV